MCVITNGMSIGIAAVCVCLIAVVLVLALRMSSISPPPSAPSVDVERLMDRVHAQTLAQLDLFAKLVAGATTAAAEAVQAPYNRPLSTTPDMTAPVPWYATETGTEDLSADPLDALMGQMYRQANDATMGSVDESDDWTGLGITPIDQQTRDH